MSAIARPPLQPGSINNLPEAAEMQNKTALRALICEDEGLTVMQLRQVLAGAGFDIVGEAMDGAKGVELAKELGPDFVLMDVNLQGMNGVEATRRIMDECPAAVIMLTAYGDD